MRINNHQTSDADKRVNASESTAISSQRFYRPVSALTAAYLIGAMALAQGCGLIFPGRLTPGSYAGELACVIRAFDENGEPVEEEFSQPTEATVGEDGSLSVNGEAIVVGGEVTRSIPTADLSFEVVRIRRGPGGVRVEYAPRPTLPGITVEGVLSERYWTSGEAMSVRGETKLDVGDVDGVRTIEVRCEGRMPRE